MLSSLVALYDFLTKLLYSQKTNLSSCTTRGWAERIEHQGQGQYLQSFSAEVTAYKCLYPFTIAEEAALEGSGENGGHHALANKISGPAVLTELEICSLVSSHCRDTI